MDDDPLFSVIITGGQRRNNGEAMNRVIRYTRFIRGSGDTLTQYDEELQGMLSPRMHHGCGSYRNAGSLVRMTQNLLFIICLT